MQRGNQLRVPSFVFGLAIILSLAAAACGGKAAGPTQVPTAPAEAPTATAAPVPPTSTPLPATATPRPAVATPTAVSAATPTTVPASPAPTQTPVPQPALNVENPPLILEVLEGKAQYRTPGSIDWFDAFDGQPVEQTWSVRTLAVSAAVLHFSDGSKVRLEPNTEVVADLYELIDGGLPKGERHARVRVIDGEIDFDVSDAPSPPNTWIFVTADGAVTIQGTKGSLKRRVSMTSGTESSPDNAASPSVPSMNVDFGVTLLDGAATVALINQDGPGDKSQVTAAVIQPGVDFKTNVDIPLPANMFDPQKPGFIDAAAPVLLGTGLADRNGDGKVDPIDIVFSEDLRVAAQRAGTAVGGRGFTSPAAPGSQGPAPSEQAQDAAKFLTGLQAVALGGASAVNDLKQGGDFEATRQKAVDQLAGSSRGANRALETFGLTQKGSDQARQNLQVLALGKDDLDPAKLGATPKEFFSNVAEKGASDDITGSKPDLNGLRHRFDGQFQKPGAMPIFDEAGKIIGVKKPDEVVFDQTGNPVGKKLGDLTAVDGSGNPVQGPLPDVFYVADPDGKETLRPTTFFNAFVPKAGGQTSDLGQPAEKPLNLVAFDKDGNVVPTIFQFDGSGRPIGVSPISQGFRDATGQTIKPPENPFFEYNDKGQVKNAKDMPFIAKDEGGNITEFKIPSPIVHDGKGAPIALMDPGKIVKGDSGVSGMEAGKVFSREAMVEFLNSGVGAGQAPGVFAAGDFDAVGKTAGDFAKGLPGESGAPSFFDTNGQAKTVYEFRPQQVFRDEKTGQQTGFRPISALTCLQKDCFQQAAGNDELLSKLEEKLQVFAKTEDGKSVVSEFQGHALFTPEGGFGGFSPPPVALRGAEGAAGFAAADVRVFTAAAGAAGAPQPSGVGLPGAAFGVNPELAGLSEVNSRVPFGGPLPASAFRR